MSALKGLFTLCDFVALINFSLQLFQANEDEKYAFVVEWYDPQASFVRQYVLHFYEHDGTIEMVYNIQAQLFLSCVFHK
jgi:hypothetical protein